MYLPYVHGLPGRPRSTCSYGSCKPVNNLAGLYPVPKPFSSACGGGRTSTLQELETEAYAGLKWPVNRMLAIFKRFFGFYGWEIAWKT